jgi:2-polyprenyl-6-methoxyphenol hydroxylase-like FAD-dependent oxidoreductase
MNLGLSHRAMSTLALIGMTKVIEENSVEVDGRQVFKKDGTSSFHFYAKRENIIYMVNREMLSDLLVKKAKFFPDKICIHFETKVNDVDIRK